MDDINNKLEFRGKSGKLHTFTHLYRLTDETLPGSEGIYVFTNGDTAESHRVLDIQLLVNKEEANATAERLKEDGATHAFFKECSDELGCDADIDDIKSGEDYRKLIE